MTDWLDKQLGKYQIVEFLGRGSMAKVYKAFQPGLERFVALKIIHPHLTHDPSFLGRFKQEAKTVATLRHPGIVQVYDFDVEDDTFYMVMEFVPGESLHKYLTGLHARNRHMSLDETLRLFRQISEAVVYAHSQNILHRDLKPANVLLTGQQEPVLADFGLSKIIGADRLHQGAILGTPAYMSPEQGLGQPGDERSDIYSLGIMLYELTTGVPPFSSDTAISTILKHLDDPLPPPHILNPTLPAAVESIIQKALQKNRADRFQSARELLAALDELAPLPTPAAARAAAPADTRCPYRGLRVFEAEHADLFFGREAYTHQLLEKLIPFAEGAEPPPVRPAQFLAVVGASGSGKSSLVQAGLVPALKQGAVPGSDRWAIHVFKPGSHPLKELAAQLSLAAQTHGAPPADRDSWLADLRANGRALHRIARQLCPGDPPARRLLLVVDQFEELFTLCRNHDDRRQFIENLLFACSAGDGRVIVLLTLRADFYHRCAAHRGLAAKLAARQILLEFMNRAELRRAIEQPARQVGLNFEPGLVDTILTDVTRQPGALPLLQHALLELWERRAGRMLTRQAYRVSGGVQGAIARRAEALYTGFDPPEQAIVRRIMLRLTQPGDGTQDTRRRARKQDLLPAPGSEQVETVETVLQQLTGARLLTVSRDMATGHDMVDVSHEALIAGWERLQSWIDEDRLALRTHRRLTDAAHEWEKENRDPRYLSHGVRLAQAEEWAAAHPHDLSDLERAYLQAGRAAAEAAAQEKEAARRRELAQARALAEAEHRRAEEQTRAGKRLRWLVAGLAVVFAVAVLAAALAVGQQQQARRQAATAQARRDIAQALQITAEAARATAEHETISRATAQANAETEARARATAQAEAEHRRAEADAARAEAERQHQLSLSRQLAAQSQTFQDERFDLALLMSVQANHSAPTIEARRSLLAQLTRHPHLTAFMHGHTDAPFRLALSPDGQTLVSASWDGTLRLWDMATRRPKGDPLIAHDGPVLGVAFSPDGKTIASAGNDATVILWDAATGRPLGQPLTGHADKVWGVAFSPNGNILASSAGGEASDIILWDVATRQPLGQPLTAHTRPVLTLAFSPNGKILASAGDSGAIILWDTATRQPLGQPLTGHQGTVWRVAFSPNGKTLASAGQDKTIRLWDVTTGEPTGDPLTGHSNKVFDVAFSPNGKILASAAQDNTLMLWDAATGEPLGDPFTGHGGAAYSILFSRDGRTLASGSQDTTIALWAVEAGQPLSEPLAGPAGAAFGATFSPNRRYLASPQEDRVVVWDVSTGQQTVALPGLPPDETALAFSPDGNLLAWPGKNDALTLWNLETGQAAGSPFEAHSSDVVSAAFSPDGAILAAGTMDTRIHLWNAATGQPLAPPLEGHRHQALALAFSPNGRTLVSGSFDTDIIVWDVAAGQPLTAPLTNHDSPVQSVVFSPDGALMASGSRDKTIIVWDTAAWQPLGKPLTGHRGYVLSVAFSPDGALLASGGQKGAVFLWDMATRQPLGRLAQGDSPVWRVAFTAGGRLLSVDQTGNLVRRDVDFASWQSRACTRANRNLTGEEWTQFVNPDAPYRLTCPGLPPPAPSP